MCMRSRLALGSVPVARCHTAASDNERARDRSVPGRKALQVLTDASGPEFVSVLVDITDLSMEDLQALPDSALASVLQDLRSPAGEGFAAFSSALL